MILLITYSYILSIHVPEIPAVWAQEAYKGSKHISFMDHGYINPPNPVNADEPYFNGTRFEIDAFWQKLRCDMREFLQQNGVR